MKIKITKKLMSNLVFICAMALLIYPPTRTWFLRQIAFSPSIENVEEREQLASYDWQLKGINTDDIDFEDLKDKIVIVNFWATWCPGCRAEKPMFQKLYADYKDKVAFVFVSNEAPVKIEAYLESNGFDFPVYASKTMPPELFLRTNSIPASYLIAKDGKVIIQKVGAADWNSSKIRNLLDDLSL